MAKIPTRRLSKRIQIIKQVRTKNQYGEFKTEWVMRNEIWASVKDQYFKDFSTSIGTQLEGTTTFMIRYDQPQEITTDLRVRFNGFDYDIIKVLEGTYANDFTTIVGKVRKKGE